MIPTQCGKCGKRFLTQNHNRKWCNKCAHNQKRDKQRSEHEIEFIGVDGEGVNRPDGTHEYILLSVGNKSLYKSDGSRLTFYDIIPFLWDCFTENPQASYIGFYLGYDFTMWLKDLPENRARILLTQEGIALRKRTKSGANHLPFPVEHRGWFFDILGTKRFRLWKNNSKHRMYICDTGSFFQTSFLNVINPKQWPDGSIVTDLEYKKIALGKSERGQDIIPYGTSVDSTMIEYNILENEILARLMNRYNEGLVNVGIRLKRDQWFGPGQAAQTWMTNTNAPTRKDFENVTPLQIRSKMRFSYYGGWFEIFAHGHIPNKSYSYDINSAYPDIQSKLPCCLHGTWRGDTTNCLEEIENESITLLYCTVRGSHNIIGAASHRIRTGHILRPQITKGWYWWHEIQAAKRAGLIDEIEIIEWITYKPCDCSSPFRLLRTLYQDRIKVGKNTIGGKARRLVYNSTYGKTAQSIGTAKYANPFYASLITSYCRTKILDAIAKHPIGASDVLMVATDGITFRHRHPNLRIDEKELGEWSEKEHQNLTLFMPGIYWDDQTREKLKLGEHPTLKSRGIPAKLLAERILEIDELFQDPYSGNGFPELDVPINFNIISPRQALSWNRWRDCGKVEFDNIRHINSDPTTKRLPTVIMKDGILQSYCYRQPFYDIESTPYNKTFGDEESKLLDDFITPDGNINMLFPQSLGE